MNVPNWLKEAALSEEEMFEKIDDLIEELGGEEEVTKAMRGLSKNAKNWVIAEKITPCPSCGQKLRLPEQATTIRCPKCKKEFTPEGDTPEIGYEEHNVFEDIAEPLEKHIHHYEPPEAPPVEKIKKTVWSLAALIAAALVAAGYSNWTTEKVQENPEQAIEQVKKVKKHKQVKKQPSKEQVHSDEWAYLDEKPNSELTWNEYKIKQERKHHKFLDKE